MFCLKKRKYDKNLLKILTNNKEVIMGMEVCKSNTKCFIIKYDFPNYILYSADSLESSQHHFIQKGSNSDLFKLLLKTCLDITSFTISVRDYIVPCLKYSDRNVIKRRTIPLEIEGWECVDKPEPNKFFAISKFHYEIE